jgi:hypothetical protein
MLTMKTVVLGAAMAAATGVVFAQEPTYDPAQFPEIQGKVSQYTLTPRGDLDGLILDNGTEVQISPRVSLDLAFAVRPGDTITIHGLKAHALPMVLAMSITNDATHATVLTGPTHRSHDRGAMIEAQGKIKAQLHDTDGEMNGVQLDNGTTVQLPPPEAQRIGVELAVGQTIYVRGAGTVNLLGRAIAARFIGPGKESATEVVGPSENRERGDRGRRGEHRNDDRD